MRCRSPLFARTLAAGLGIIAVAAGCASEREASSAPPISEVAVAGSVAAAPPTSANTVLDVEHVAMVGDSITEGSLPELTAAFESIGFAEVEINAESGRKTIHNDGVTSGVEGVAEVLEDGPEPDLWVVALGTNDVANEDPAEYPALVSGLLATIPVGTTVVWVDTYLEEYEDEAAAFDATLRQVLAERGDASVVDWYSIAGQDGVLTDGVHPSGFGRAEFARRVTDAVSAWTS